MIKKQTNVINSMMAGSFVASLTGPVPPTRTGSILQQQNTRTKAKTKHKADDDRQLLNISNSQMQQQNTLIF